MLSSIERSGCLEIADDEQSSRGVGHRGADACRRYAGPHVGGVAAVLMGGLLMNRGMGGEGS